MASGLSPQLAKWGAYYRCYSNLSIIFLDVASLPSLFNRQYWTAWLVARVLFTDPDYAVLLPPVRQIRLKVFDHWNLDGSTKSHWKLVAWYLQAADPCKPVIAPAQPWILLHARIDEMAPLPHFAAPKARFCYTLLFPFRRIVWLSLLVVFFHTTALSGGLGRG